MAWTATELLSSIKRRAQVPSAQSTFQDADLLTIANEEMLLYIVPFVLKAREDYWTKNNDQALADGTLSYRMPYRAIAGKLREVSILDAQGFVHDIPRVNIADLEYVDFGFWLESDSVWLVNDGTLAVTSQYGTTIRQTFNLRPNQIVTVASATTVASFNANAKTITLTSPPASYTGNTSWDIVRARTPFDTLTYDAAGTLAGSVITFSASLPADLAAGDYVCLAEQSPVPQIPIELHGLLAQKCAIKILEAKQQLDKLQSAREELSRLEADVATVLSPRVDGEALRVTNRTSLYRTRM